MESEIWHRGSYLENRNRLTDTENRLVVAKGEGGGSGTDKEFIDANGVLLHGTGNYVQSPVIEHDGR